MPNLAARLGASLTVAVPGPGVGQGGRDRVDHVLGPGGDVILHDREADLDAVTALSGSGPAYFYRFTEALASAGEAVGLPAELATRLARATLVAAAAVAARDDRPLAQLRHDVTRRGGVTDAGLERLDAEGQIDAIMRVVIEAAALRSQRAGAPTALARSVRLSDGPWVPAG